MALVLLIAGLAGAQSAARATTVAPLPPPVGPYTYPLPSNRPVKTAVILVNFPDDASTPFTADEVRKTIFTGPGHDRDHPSDTRYANQFFKEASNNRFWLQGRDDPVNGDVFGWYTVPNLSKTRCDPSEFDRRARDYLVNTAKHSLDGYDDVITITNGAPGTLCWWYGMAMGSAVVVNGEPQWNVIVHETGHAFGLGHAGRFRCELPDHTYVTVSTSCSESTVNGLREYDGFTPMGASNYLYSGPEKMRIGWIPPANVATATSSATFTLRASEDLLNGTQVIRIPHAIDSSLRTTEWLELELRRPYGAFDNFSSSDNVVNGVSVRLYGRNDTVDGVINSALLDATPRTPTFNDAALVPGASMYDSQTGVTITTLSLDKMAHTAQVQVTFASPSTYATAQVVNGELRYTGAPGTSSDAVFTPGSVAGDVVVHDARPMKELDPTCSAMLDGGARCHGVTTINADAGDLDDRITVHAPVPSIVHGGDGNDTLIVDNGVADSVQCGGGVDDLSRDGSAVALDQNTNGDCERVHPPHWSVATQPPVLFPYGGDLSAYGGALYETYTTGVGRPVTLRQWNCTDMDCGFSLQDLGGGANGPPVVLATFAGQDVAVRGGGDHVYYKNNRCATGSPCWTGWEDVSTDATGRTITTSAGPNLVLFPNDGVHYALIVRGPDSALWARVRCEWCAQTWSNWMSAGGRIVGGPGGASLNGGRRAELFGIGADGGLYQNTIDCSAACTFTGWKAAGSLGDPCCLTGDVDATSAGDGVVDIVVGTSRHDVWTRRYRASGWDAWEDPIAHVPGGVALGRSAIAATGNGRLTLAVPTWTKLQMQATYDPANP